MKYLLLVLVLFVASCGTNEEWALKLNYFKDSRTGLCFAERAWGMETGVVTNVPCTPEVERMINPAYVAPKPTPTVTPSPSPTIEKSKSS
jgi:hypothetical protein